MRTFLMKVSGPHLPVSAVVAGFACGALHAQDESPRWAPGLGVGWHSYSTAMYNSTTCAGAGPCVHYHEFRRVQFAVFAERDVGRDKTMARALRLESRVGFVGGTKDDSSDFAAAYSIADGGVSVGLGATYHVALMGRERARTAPAVPYAGAGVDFSMLRSNGTVSGSQDYEPWTEYVVALPVLVFGGAIRRGNVVVRPELRWSPFGFSRGSWEEGDPEQDSAPKTLVLQVGFARARR